MDESTPLLQDQRHHLPRKRLLIVFPALALIQFTSFLDQTAISTSLPAIASAIHTGASISLVGASFLITSTSIQLINGRLSDIFGRKACLSSALIIMGLGNLLSGFCKTPTEMFVSRAFTGFGAGAINALVQIAMADITTLEQRGYYFGMMGIAVALGNGLGPVIGGILTQSIGWQWAFWFVCPLTAVAAGYFLLVWPKSHSTSASADQIWPKVKLVDWLGAGTSLGAIALFLISISQGGSTIPWNSPAIFIMLVASGILACTFYVVETRVAKLPMVPAHLFLYGRSTNILIFINLIVGFVFWGNLFTIPLYLQNTRGMSPGEAGILILPMVIAHGLTSGITGIIISHFGHYKPVIVTGAVSWLVAVALKLRYDQSTPLWLFAIAAILDGIGVGCSLQPVLIGLFAGTFSKDRAVLTGLRNFLRDMGGAIGTTVSGAILSNVLTSQLKNKFPDKLIAELTSSAFALKDLKLPEADKKLISRTYVNGIHAIFIAYAILIVIHLCACVFIQDYGLERRDKEDQDGQEENAETNESQQ